MSGPHCHISTSNISESSWFKIFEQVMPHDSNGQPKPIISEGIIYRQIRVGRVAQDPLMILNTKLIRKQQHIHFMQRHIFSSHKQIILNRLLKHARNDIYILLLSESTVSSSSRSYCFYSNCQKAQINVIHTSIVFYLFVNIRMGLISEIDCQNHNLKKYILFINRQYLPIIYQFIGVLQNLILRQQIVGSYRRFYWVLLDNKFHMGKIVQNYSLQQLIGEGGYGKVFKGFHVITRQQVAVKVIRSEKFKEIPKLEECTVNEINTLSSIEQSPHIVRYLDMLKTTNNYYFIYEYCNGGTLSKVIQGCKGQQGEVMPLKLALEYFRQLLEAFKVLTQHHIMHRDLKPDNILLHNSKLKVADFGFCKSLEGPTDIAQTMLGSPIYMAPEVIRGEPYSIKADIWSLGVVFYEMLYGFCPYNSSSIAKLIQVLEKEDLRFPIPTSVNIQSLLRRILSKDPAKRIDWSQLFQLRFSEEDVIFPTTPRSNRQYQRRPLGSCNIQQRRHQKTQSQLFLKKSESGSSGKNSQMTGSYLNSPEHCGMRQRKSSAENITTSFSKQSKNQSSSIFKESNGKPKPKDLVKQHENFSIAIRACLDLIIAENCFESIIVGFTTINQVRKEQSQILLDMQKYFSAQQLIQNEQLSIILSTIIQEMNQLKIIEDYLKGQLQKKENPGFPIEDLSTVKSRIHYLKIFADKSVGMKQKVANCSINFLQLIDFFERLGCLKPETYRCLNKEQLAQSVMDRLAKMS